MYRIKHTDRHTNTKITENSEINMSGRQHIKDTIIDWYKFNPKTSDAACLSSRCTYRYYMGCNLNVDFIIS